MHRFALLTLAAAACGGNHATATPPSSRAPERAAVAGCDDATLRAFDPGLPGIQRVAVQQWPEPDPPLAREHVRACEVGEGDDVCQARARREVLAADPNAVIGDVTLRGERPPPPTTPEPNAPPRLVEGPVMRRADGKSAVVSYEVPLPAGTRPRLRWEVALHWPLPPEAPAAIERMTTEAERASLVVVGYEVADNGINAVVACP